jgi:sarcosine oxidase
VVCAGLATGPLVAPLGLDVGVEARHHVRLTYRMREPAVTACLIAPEAYALPLGSTGRFAVGMHEEDGGVALGAITAEEAAAAVRRQHARWVPRTFPGLAGEPIDDVRCVSLEADWIGPAGDGFVAERSGPVIAFGASNVMKFGPLVGERLAAMAIADGPGVHPDLRGRSPCLAAPRSSPSSAPSRSSSA